MCINSSSTWEFSPKDHGFTFARFVKGEIVEEKGRAWICFGQNLLVLDKRDYLWNVFFVDKVIAKIFHPDQICLF